MAIQRSEQDCRCCGYDYVWDDKKFLNDPGICHVCDGQECVYCGKYVRVSASNKQMIHIDCLRDQLEESIGSLIHP